MSDERTADRPEFGETAADDPAGENLHEYPEFVLGYLYDDEEMPTEVTVFADDDPVELVTRWITIDVEHAVPIEQVR